MCIRATVARTLVAKSFVRTAAPAEVSETLLRNKQTQRRRNDSTLDRDDSRAWTGADRKTDLNSIPHIGS